MLEIDKKYLQGFTAIEILKNAYSDTLGQIALDIQHQINDSLSWKETNSFLSGVKLSEREIYEIDKEVAEKTNYVKSLLLFYVDYNWPSKEIQELCRFYGIKTFNDKKTIQHTL